MQSGESLVGWDVRFWGSRSKEVKEHEPNTARKQFRQSMCHPPIPLHRVSEHCSERRKICLTEGYSLSYRHSPREVILEVMGDRDGGLKEFRAMLL